MRISIPAIRIIMDELNTNLFDGCLDLSRIKIRKSTSKSMGAYIKYGRLSLDVRVLAVSTSFVWTEQDLIDCLAHELIHVYECQIARVSPSHSGVFIEKANELNEAFKGQLNITITRAMQRIAS